MRLWYVSWDEYWSGRKKEEKQFWDLVKKLGLDEMEESQWDINRNLKERCLIEDKGTKKGVQSNSIKMAK